MYIKRNSKKASEFVVVKANIVKTSINTLAIKVFLIIRIEKRENNNKNNHKKHTSSVRLASKSLANTAAGADLANFN